jgi:hypothetical protein
VPRDQVWRPDRGTRLHTPRRLQQCAIVMAPDDVITKAGFPPALVLRHEIAHCNGWPADHRGARTFVDRTPRAATKEAVEAAAQGEPQQAQPAPPARDRADEKKKRRAPWRHGQPAQGASSQRKPSSAAGPSRNPPPVGTPYSTGALNVGRVGPLENRRSPWIAGCTSERRD